MNVYELEAKLKEAGIAADGFEEIGDNGVVDTVFLPNEWQVQYWRSDLFILVDENDDDVATMSTVEELIKLLKS